MDSQRPHSLDRLGAPGRWRASRVVSLERLCLLSLLLQFHGALFWLVRTWREQSYQSFGFVALIVALVLLRRLPPRRLQPSRPHLVGLLGVAGLDLALSPLGINVLSAALCLVALQLWLVSFRRVRGSWLAQPQLWLGLLSLPAVHWANVLFGFHLQQAVSHLAALGLRVYGLPVAVQGTVLSLPGATFAVDASCSGLKLLYSGVVLGLVLGAGARVGPWRRLLFWLGLLAALWLANVVRVISLAVGHLQLGRPVSETAHQGIGLVAFAMAALVALWLWRRLAPAPGAPVGEPGPVGAAAGQA